MSFVARTGSKIIRRQSGRFESFSSESFHRSDSVRRSSGTIKVSPYCCPHFTCLFPSQNFSARTQFLPIKAAAALLRCASLPRRHHASIRNSLCSYRPNARLLRRTAWLRFENKGFRRTANVLLHINLLHIRTCISRGQAQCCGRTRRGTHNTCDKIKQQKIL